MAKEDLFHLGAKGLIYNKEGHLLLLQQALKRPHKDGAFVWDLPGGRVHRGESLEEAFRREVQEETGLGNLSQFHLLTMVLSPSRIPLQEGDVGLILAIYLCPIPDKKLLIQLSEEHFHSVWVEPREAAKLLAVNHPADLVKKIEQLQGTLRAEDPLCPVARV